MCGLPQVSCRFQASTSAIRSFESLDTGSSSAVSAMRLGLSGSVLCKFPLLQLCWFSVVYFRFLAFVVSVLFLSVSKVPSIVWVSIAVSTSLLSNFLCHPQARFWVRKLLRFFAKCWRGLQSVGKIRVLCIQHNTVAVVVSTCAAS